MEYGHEIWIMESKDVRAGYLMTVSRDLSQYKLDLVGVQEVRWEGGGTSACRTENFALLETLQVPTVRELHVASKLSIWMAM
jgi:hypothetical protein